MLREMVVSKNCLMISVAVTSEQELEDENNEVEEDWDPVEALELCWPVFVGPLVGPELPPVGGFVTGPRLTRGGLRWLIGHYVR
jgi:hypothetical protein